MRAGRLLAGGALCAALLGVGEGAVAQDAGILGLGVETRGGYCNDNYFGSDGGGITGCMEYAARYRSHTAGVGIFGATPEQQGDLKSDRLDSLGKLSAWYARDLQYGAWDYQLGLRAGIYGGTADDLAEDIRDVMHDLFGYGQKDLTSTADTSFFGGVSGWARTGYRLNDAGDWATSLMPYVHAAAGNDTIEAGGGLLLALQLAGEESLALALPKNGAYAPTFGGDGVGLFAGARGVAHEILYDERASPYIAEAGITAQATMWDFAVLGVSASCTTEPYDSASKADCKATLQMGGRF